MKTKLTFLFMVLFTSLYSQCNNFQLIPFGTSKIKAITLLYQNKNISKVNIQDDYWETYEYLEGDSVLISMITFTLSDNQCFNRNAEVILKFEDKILYKISYELEFKPEDFEICKSIFDKIMHDIENLPAADGYYFSYKIPLDLFETYDEIEEQVGEGIRYLKSAEERTIWKNYNLNIGYKFRYAKKWDNITQNFIKTGTIEKFTLEIDFNDFTITKKLDRRGY